MPMARPPQPTEQTARQRLLPRVATGGLEPTNSGDLGCLDFAMARDGCALRGCGVLPHLLTRSFTDESRAVRLKVAFEVVPLVQVAEESRKRLPFAGCRD